MLVYHCPTTRKDFTDDTILDRDTYVRQRMQIVAANCPHCGRTHRFLMADVKFAASAA
jgi:transposase-like protein